jgi:hypothetical protein
VIAARRKPEDSAEGCRSLERADRLRALAVTNPHMRECLERSADAWLARASLLERLEESFAKRAAELNGDRIQLEAEHPEAG